MAAPIFNTRFDNAADKAFREGRRPGDNTRLGPNPNPITDPKDFANAFIRRTFNPNAEDPWKTSIFSAEDAANSQIKINQAATSDLPPTADRFVKDFAYKYSGPGGAIEKGLVSPENAITKERLASLIAEPAAAGTSNKMEETVGIFPSKGVAI